MKWGALSAALAVIGLIVLYEWPRFSRGKKSREKAAFVILVGIGAVLAALLIFFPDMPGPTQMIDRLYRPLGRLLE
ncbi:hypothetical protein AB6A23_26010 [Paenibacillus tarimensis]